MEGLVITFGLGIIMVWAIYFYVKWHEKKHKHN